MSRDTAAWKRAEANYDDAVIGETPVPRLFEERATAFSNVDVRIDDSQVSEERRAAAKGEVGELLVGPEHRR